MRQTDSLTKALVAGLLLCCLAPLQAQPDRIQATLDEPPPPIPLVNTLGRQIFDEAMASGKYQYVGNAKCRLCHREFFIGRKKDLHDFALEKVIGLGHGENPRCLTCHATGYGVDTGFTSMEETPRLANVQCEGCHGPGNVHVKLRDAGGFLAGTDRPDRIHKMCRSCHTERWNRSFHEEEFETVYKKYKNPTPK